MSSSNEKWLGTLMIVGSAATYSLAAVLVAAVATMRWGRKSEADGCAPATTVSPPAPSAPRRRWQLSQVRRVMPTVEDLESPGRQ